MKSPACKCIAAYDNQRVTYEYISTYLHSVDSFKMIRGLVSLKFIYA